MADARTGGERAALEAMVDAQREEAVRLLDGLTEGEARARLVPSLTTVLGLLTHLTFVEGVWFAHRIDGVPRVDLGLPEEVDPSFVPAADATIESVRADYLAACARSRAILAEHPDLEERFAWHAGEVDLRFILLHMVREIARHAGHGDILREQLLARRG